MKRPVTMLSVLATLLVCLQLTACTPLSKNDSMSQDQQPPRKEETPPTPQPPTSTPTLQDFKGLALKKAQQLADTHQIKHRVVNQDDQPLPVTKDYRPDRLNFTVNEGKVTNITKG